MFTYLLVKGKEQNEDDDDDVELRVLGCRVDIFGTNCDQCVCMVQRKAH